MDNTAQTIEKQVTELLEMWKQNYNTPLAISDLMPTVKPMALMNALIEILENLGIDREAIVAPPPEEERDEHTEYYWDLIPLINMTRIVNHLLVGIQIEFRVTLMNLLNPTTQIAFTVLRIFTNLETYYADRCKEIAPREKELFQDREKVSALEEEKNRLLDLRNEQAAAKASRSMRLQKLEEDKRRLEEEIKRERQYNEKELRELEQVEAYNQQLQAQLDKRRQQREQLLAEYAKVKAQKVTDVEEVRAQYEQAVRGVKEVEERVDALKENLFQKESAVKNLLAVKEKLKEGITYVQEITAHTALLREVNMSNNRDQAEADSALSEQESALRETEMQLTELQKERREMREQREKDAAMAKLAIAQAQRSAHEAEARKKTSQERAERAEERLLVIQANIDTYAKEKQHNEDTLQHIENDFHAQLKSFEQMIIGESKKAVRVIEEKLNKLNKG